MNKCQMFHVSSRYALTPCPSPKGRGETFPNRLLKTPFELDLNFGVEKAIAAAPQGNYARHPA